MATEARKQSRAVKREQRARIKRHAKTLKAEARRKADIELGKTVIVTEVLDADGKPTGEKKYDFPPKQKVFEPPTPPRLSWLGGKMYRHSHPRKNLSGHSPEHAEANNENASRAFATEVAKAMTPVEEPNAISPI